MTIRITHMTSAKSFVNSPVFEGLAEQATDALVQGGAPVEYQNGEFLIRQGDTSNFALILIVGAADVLVETTYGTANLPRWRHLHSWAKLAYSRMRDAPHPSRPRRRFSPSGLAATNCTNSGNESGFLSRMMLQLGRRLETVNKSDRLLFSCPGSAERNEFDVKLLDELTQPLPELADFPGRFLGLLSKSFFAGTTCRDGKRPRHPGRHASRPALAGALQRYVDVQAFMRPQRTSAATSTISSWSMRIIWPWQLGTCAARAFQPHCSWR